MGGAEISCPTCRGARYVIEAHGERSVAKACGCNDSCSACEGSGRLFVEKDGYTFVKACACRTAAQRVLRFNQARLPARCGISFDTFIPANDVQATARNTAMTTAHLYRPDAPSKGFLVAGPVGSGKTHLLCATLRHLTLELGVAARYVELSFLYSEIRKGFGEHRSGLDAIQPLVDVDVLAVDELGKGKGSPFELDTLDELIARRYNANRTTLFATNLLTGDEKPRAKGYQEVSAHFGGERLGDMLLRDRVGERIYSRLYEMCRMIQLPPNTPDHRRVETR